MQGLIKPPDCPAFGTRCTPEHPLGATMVSNEGACAAYYRYRRLGLAETGGGAAVGAGAGAQVAVGAGSVGRPRVEVPVGG
jgi:hydrogenase expression/formation protein HypD